MLLALINHYGLNGETDIDQALYWYREAKLVYKNGNNQKNYDFVQNQRKQIFKPGIIQGVMEANINWMCSLQEPIRNSNLFISISLLSGCIKVGDKISINNGSNSYLTKIKAIGLFDLLVDHCDTTLIPINIYVQGVTSNDDKLLFNIADDENIEDEEYEKFKIKLIQ